MTYEEVLIDKVKQDADQNGAGIILMDYHLGFAGVSSGESELLGSEVAEGLIKDGYPELIIGFSSDERAEKAFKDVGAVGSIKKNPDAPKQSIVDLAKFLSKTDG
jgi:hypothetical protein